MFAAALKRVEKYTLPVVVLQRFFDGSVASNCGSCIVVNPEGWVLTAFHIVQQMILAAQHRTELDQYDRDRQAIESTPLRNKEKEKQIRRLVRNPKWITNQAVIWGGLTGQVNQFHCNPIADIAIGKIDPFDSKSIEDYPTFQNPAEEMPVGTSLCRLGFPFHNIGATYDPATDQFTLAPDVYPVPRFPNDGIHTRLVIMKSPDGKEQAKFLETSTPGLRGQSGGPIFDTQGHIWAMQSQTNSLPLGFAPTVKQGNKEIVEHQFMHVGFGSHVEEIIGMFQKYGVQFTSSS